MNSVPSVKTDEALRKELGLEGFRSCSSGARTFPFQLMKNRTRRPRKDKAPCHFTLPCSVLTSLSLSPYLFLCRGRGVACDHGCGHETCSGSCSCVDSHYRLSLPPPPPAQNEHGCRDGSDAGSRSGGLLNNAVGERGCDRILSML